MNESESKLTYKKIIRIPEADIRLRHDDIVHVHYNEGTTIDVPLQLRMLEKFNEICEGKKLPFLFEAMDYVTVTREAKVNAIKMEDLTPVKATAILAPNLAYKLLAEFYIKVNKPKGNFKIFRKHEDAIEWLKQYLD
jgi:hypothetical protein